MKRRTGHIRTQLRTCLIRNRKKFLDYKTEKFQIIQEFYQDYKKYLKRHHSQKFQKLYFELREENESKNKQVVIKTIKIKSMKRRGEFCVHK